MYRAEGAAASRAETGRIRAEPSRAEPVDSRETAIGARPKAVPSWRYMLASGAARSARQGERSGIGRLQYSGRVLYWEGP